MKTVRVTKLENGNFRFEDIDLQPVGEVSREVLKHGGDETTIHCPLDCDSIEDETVAQQLTYSRIGKLLFCKCCAEGFAQ